MAALAMPAASLRAAGLSDVGRQRDVNEDRLLIDTARGIFIVVDGVGGQAAGGRAADIAIGMLRERLERQTGSLTDRVREAITIANNAIFRAALGRPEWHGMACVLTVSVVEGDRAIVGHVGDTRMYLLRGQDIEKVTPDHSPVGEREDAHEISEAEAMRHPRRNEVFRDVGSSMRDAAAPDFVFVDEIAFPPDAALLLCSDGLTDLVPLRDIKRIADAARGEPERVASALVAAANDAGGKDNVTVVYVEGAGVSGRAADSAEVETVRLPRARRRTLAALTAGAIIGILASVLAGVAWQQGWVRPARLPGLLAPLISQTIVVRNDESIAAAIARAQPGQTVAVEPGEYRERLMLRDHVRVVSRVPRGATLRLPGASTEQEAAVVATGVTGAELAGFRIVGDAASPLGTGVITRDAEVRLVDLEVTGATVAGIDIGAGGDVVVTGVEIHDNPGTALVIRSAAAPRIAHNAFARNATSERAVSALVVEAGAQPTLSQNVFLGVDAQALRGFDAAGILSLPGDNWFIDTRSTRTGPEPGSGRGR
jgi:serine/threonine protein phosphatase PrpC